MKEIQKNLEVASYLNGVWHDPIKETPKKDGALCIVSVGVDEDGKDAYDLFPWDEKMKAFDTGVGHYIDEDLKDQHAWICPEGCTRWCYLEDLLPEPRQTGECTEADPAKLEFRFALRKKLYEEYGESQKEEMEKAFSWIYNSPLRDWNNMVYAISKSYINENGHTTGPHLEKAKELFDFLS